ncbi:hypothetical protein QAD02_004883 [Eretmocerus hayati]|uniref:Uncharacterized protein n=1 Tax=Eretmocerus hayati TaxID=131215 RepID=A0ACC2NRW3_9HYME|nr:hypothetical protein QAD02_004883 [Eretmocerus hayati]
MGRKGKKKQGDESEGSGSAQQGAGSSQQSASQQHSGQSSHSSSAASTPAQTPRGSQGGAWGGSGHSTPQGQTPRGPQADYQQQRPGGAGPPPREQNAGRGRGMGRGRGEPPAQAWGQQRSQPGPTGPPNQSARSHPQERPQQQQQQPSSAPPGSQAWGQQRQQQQQGQGQRSQQAQPQQQQQWGQEQQQQSTAGTTTKPAWGPKPQQQPAQQQQASGAQPSFWGKPQQQQSPQGAPQAQSARPQQHQQQSQKQSKIQQSDVQEAASSMSQLSVQPKDSSPAKTQFKVSVSSKDAQNQSSLIPKRRNPEKAGTLGTKIKVLVNMMEIHFGQRFPKDVIHYDVAFMPETPKYLLRRAFTEARNRICPQRNPAFDGKKNAYSAGNLFDGDERSVEVTVFNEDGKEKVFKVTLKKVDVLDLMWIKNVYPGFDDSTKNQHCLQALDIILRNAPSLRSTIVGRSFFVPPRNPRSLGGGMDLWQGLFQSAVIGWKPFLNIDVAHKGFPKGQGVLDTIKNICGNAQPTADDYTTMVQRNQETIDKFLKGLKVVYQIPHIPTSRRTYRVNGLLRKTPREDVFEHEGHRISVEQYYRLQKQYTIRYPNLPLLWVGTKEKNIHVPIELCDIVSGQATQKKLDEKQTSNMIRAAATGTEDRKRKIMDAFQQMNYGNDPCMREFDVKVSGEFTNVDARILNPPNLQYKERPMNVNKGVWRAGKFLNPVNLAEGQWTIICLDNRTTTADLQALANSLQQAAGEVGMNIGRPSAPFELIDSRNVRNLEENLKKFKTKNFKLVVAVIPDFKGPYNKVKQTAELRIGVLTQCIKSKTLRRLDQSTCGNILLKINAKLNGTNHVLSPTTRDRLPACLAQNCYAMMVGADVTHPSPDATGIPSIAAVVASHDPQAFKYNTQIRLQPPRQELIEDLMEIMWIHLNEFKKATGKHPSQIVFFRDGVSEGQFGQVMHHELNAIRQACARCKIKIPITFLVVQKRHHIRFFPTHENDSDDSRKGFNVKAGTIVDTQITHPAHIDFYLVSHASIQGTARPTKYRCLWDDANMSEDEIEKLTYYLCHMFTRCTRSVSYPTPTYYAHLAAFRARALTQDVNIDLDNLANEQRMKMTIRPDVLNGNPMFFV